MREHFISMIIEHILRILSDRVPSPAERLCVMSAAFVATAKADGLDRDRAMEAISFAWETVPDLPQEPAR